MRITLGGGGTDLPSYYSLYQGFVLTMGIDKYFYSILKERKDNKIQLISADYQIIETIHDLDMSSAKLTIPKVVIEEMGLEKGADIFMSSEVPPGTGLGSSGSAIVNIIKALSLFNGLDLDKKKIAEMACFLEIDKMKAPVGKQDQYIAAYGGIQNLIINKKGHVTVEPLRMPGTSKKELEENIMIFYTGVSRKSSDILSQQSKGSSKTMENLNFIKELGFEIRDALSRGDLSTFGELLNKHWEFKKNLVNGVSNEKIDALYNLGLKKGALGGKLLGAGGGGFLLFYCEHGKESVREEMLTQGLSELNIKIDNDGVKTILNAYN